MMLSSLVFLDGKFHQALLRLVAGHTYFNRAAGAYQFNRLNQQLVLAFMGFYFLVQTLVPFRYLLYPAPLFWYEEGYRFSWRVMLMEKSGNTFFYVKEPASGRVFEVNNQEFLTPQQERMMSTQPDMIIRYAHYLKKVYQARRIHNPEVYAEGYVALNGLPSKPFINPKINLSAQKLSWHHVQFILPFSK